MVPAGNVCTVLNSRLWTTATLKGLRTRLGVPGVGVAGKAAEVNLMVVNCHLLRLSTTNDEAGVKEFEVFRERPGSPGDN